MSKAAAPPTASHPPPPYFPSTQRTISQSRSSPRAKYPPPLVVRSASPKPASRPSAGVAKEKQLALAKVVAHLARERQGQAVEIVKVDPDSDNAWPLPIPAENEAHGELSAFKPVRLGKRREPSMEECARLCSQHHQSAYSRSKWGQQGCPQMYQPLSVVAPAHASEIMSAQERLESSLLETGGIVWASRYSALTPALSAASSPSTSMSMSSASDASLIMEPTLLDGSQHAVFTAEPASLSTVSLALTEPEDNQSVGTQSSLWTLDSDGVWTDAQAAMDVDEQPSGLASSVGAFSMTRDFAAEEGLEGLPCGPCAGDKRTNVAVSEWEQEEEKRRRIKEAMEEPLVRSKDLSSVPVVDPLPSTPPLRHPVKTSETHPINISPFLPLDVLPVLNSACTVLPSQDPEYHPDPIFITTPRSSNLDVSSLILSQPAQYPYKLPELGDQPSPFHQLEELVRQRRPADQGPSVGNLLLSSCPGKKVRLAGPVKGRGAICRDLETDLRRIRDEGVGCIVCCLDDKELELLGSPWEEYRRKASVIGLDVIRIPMPEGFTPASVEMFDKEIELIVKEYSLKGINVLTHCRGGVGRAGLTACAWAIKMGFVRPDHSLLVAEQDAVSPEISSQEFYKRHPNLEPDTLEHFLVMSTVERAIEMIRRRRSIKAIETFEQVSFLVAYVDWLRRSGKLSTATA